MREPAITQNKKSNKFIILGVIFLITAVAAGLAGVRSTEATSKPIVSNWWPADNASIGGVQPFKGLLDDWNVNDYSMYWSVDGGQLNLMPTNTTGYPHKESVVDVNGWDWRPNNVYNIDFIAKNNTGSEIARTTFSVTVPSTNITMTPASPTTATTATPPGPTSNLSSPPPATSSLGSLTFYTDPDSNAKQQADAWRSSRPSDAAQLDKIAAHSQSKWFGGWNNDLASDVNTYVSAAAAKSAVPVLVAYNIPQRDCGGYSAGNTTADAYLSWIKTMTSGIGTHQALVVLEPDSLANLDCLSAADQATRLSLLSQAVSMLKANAGTHVYLDAGNPHWKTADVIAARLNKANITAADGFTLNVSNFYTTADNTTYGQLVSGYVNHKHFIIDTSRNGLGPTADGQWCNPSGRALGNVPTTQTANTLIDAYIWIKSPGESDGTCNGGPAAGAWWGNYALGLAQRADY